MRNIARNCRNSGPPPQAQDALREDGGNLGDSLFRGHVGGVGGIVDEGHRRSFVRGDARNDLRLATGAMPGNRMRETGTSPIPSSLIYRVGFGIGCSRGTKATGLLTGKGSDEREPESSRPGTAPGRERGARAAFPGALTPSDGPFGRDVNPCNYWRKRKNPATSRQRGSSLTGGSR